MSSRIRTQLRLLLVSALSIGALALPGSALAAPNPVVTPQGAGGHADDETIEPGFYSTDSNGLYSVRVANDGDAAITNPRFLFWVDSSKLAFNELAADPQSISVVGSTNGAPGLVDGPPVCDSTVDSGELLLSCRFNGSFPAGASADLQFTLTGATDFDFGTADVSMNFGGTEGYAGPIVETTTWMAGTTYLEVTPGQVGGDTDGENAGGEYDEGDTIPFRVRLFEDAALNAEVAHGVVVSMSYDPAYLEVDPADVASDNATLGTPTCTDGPDGVMVVVTCSFDGYLDLNQASYVDFPALALDNDWEFEIDTFFLVETANSNAADAEGASVYHEQTYVSDDVNAAPTCDFDPSPGAQHHSAGSAISFDLDTYCSDLEGSTLTYGIDTSNPWMVVGHGTVTIGAGNVLTWTPPAGFLGYDGVYVTASDGVNTTFPEYVELARYENADLGVVWDGPLSGNVGVPMAYTVTVRNLATFTGAETASRVDLSFYPPSEATPGATPAGCEYRTETDMGYTYRWYECSFANLAPGATHSVVFTFAPTKVSSSEVMQGVYAYVSGSGRYTDASDDDDYVSRTLAIAAAPPAPTCAAGQTGTYPDCVTPVPQCPAGTTGVHPNCLTPKQQLMKSMDDLFRSVTGAVNLLTQTFGALQFGGQVTAVQPKGGALATGTGSVVSGIVACRSDCIWNVAYSATFTPKATARAKKGPKAVTFKLPAQKLVLKANTPGALKTKLSKAQLAQVKKGKAPKIVATVTYQVGKVKKVKKVTMNLKFAPARRR